MLRLMEGDPDWESKKRAGHANIAFYQLCRRDIFAAHQTLQQIDNFNSYDRRLLLHWLRQEEDIHTSMSDKSKQRNLVLDRLPRYKADILGNVREYFALGHEILIPTPIAPIRPGTRANIMICGLGDSGYLFSTLLALDSPQDKIQTQHAHITVIDINPTTIARMLVIFQLMILHQRNSKTGTGPHTLSPRFAIMLCYLFSSPLVPITAIKFLGLALDDLIGEIALGKTTFCGLVYLPFATRYQVYVLLKRWKIQTEGPSPAGSLTCRILAQRESRLDKPLHVPRGRILFQRDVFKQLGALVPWREEHASQFPDPSFIEAVRTYSCMYENDHTSQNMRGYLDMHWRLNPTLVDFELTSVKRSFSVNLRPLVWPNWSGPSPHQCHFDPTEVLGTFIKVAPPETFESPSGECFFDALIQVLTRVDVARKRLSGQVLVEAIVGEVTDVMERIRYDALSHRQPTGVHDPDANPVNFPKVYDGIHMGSLPDYTGGMFSVAYYAGPLLRKHDDDQSTQSMLRFRISLNYPLFKSYESYMAEYLAMTGEDTLRGHFGLERLDPVCIPGHKPMSHYDNDSDSDSDDNSDNNNYNSERNSDSSSISDIDSLVNNYDDSWCPGRPDSRYDNYMWLGRTHMLTDPKSPHYQERLPRAVFLHTFFSYLLKIVLPYPRPNSSYWPTPGRWQVDSPLNLTAILRFVEHMVVQVGYSSKWISDALTSVCFSVIDTTAREPRSLAALPEEVETMHPSKRISLVPWRAEFTTLLGIWRPLLPFGILIPRSGPDRGLPGLKEICHCSVAFPTLFTGTIVNFSRKSKHYMLVFLNAKATSVQEVEGSLYSFLLTPDDGCVDSPLGLGIRGGGVHIITTFTFDARKKMAEFWMRDDVVAELKSGNWIVYLWRTDTWRKASDGVDARTLVPGEHWLDKA
ncbi:hypothetical protein MCOR31_006448 [Pyricularia oryzae]|uniref:DUF4470 domain-containing protein n=2 Tax=Pyricularia TaxID=48558 RepID=A0ABQ8N9Z2_PYRGI|nr:hypothetical protein MCOR26_006463 [Pyricularia oryzae]KAI6293664.1 hypothetical protein MCOR33_008955 [Pyricularia grisea]KAI6303426.1 hypothetical protein MCOR34_008848 [Pyricularia oryzae]KAI6330150.1 hypothetical protein MCOR30_005225 [Pyricularia oryzae]KAI6353442.1 hypothetical protein MCOR32_010893 [Pyricularia oryzae]